MTLALVLFQYNAGLTAISMALRRESTLVKSTKEIGQSCFPTLFVATPSTGNDITVQVFPLK